MKAESKEQRAWGRELGAGCREDNGFYFQILYDIGNNQFDLTLCSMLHAPCSLLSDNQHKLITANADSPPCSLLHAPSN
jgi:hypothetical protein